jgi:hypothetical protein
MRSQTRRTTSPSRRSLRRDAKREIKNFMEALGSYPSQFARDPQLSFEKYFRVIRDDPQNPWLSLGRRDR